MIKYIDFDGVIFDTEVNLFDSNYYELKEQPGFSKEEYVQNIDWYNLIMKSKEINDSIKLLKEMKDAIILTKINSLYNEASAKIKILRDLDVRNNIILVPFNYKKSNIVRADGNILVDDTVHNLVEWEKDGGVSLFFSKDGRDTDNWGNKNTKYTKIKSLEYLRRF